MSDLMDKARGRWREILKRLGLDESFMKDRHGPCPVCGGKDRFRFDDKNGNGTYYCNACGAGDGWLLAQKLTGKSAKETAKSIFDMVGDIQPSKSKPPIDYEKNRRRLLAIMENCDVISDITAVRKYLRNRSLPMSKHLFFHPGLPYYEQEKYFGKFPAMIGKFFKDDKCFGLHVTYLTPDGEKANVSSPKKILPPCGELAGSAIKLTEIYPTMGLAEGIETALAVMKLFNIPCWAAGTAGLLEKFEPPRDVLELKIYADKDQSFTGEAAAYKLARRLSDKIKVEVFVPKHRGTDFADYVGEKNARSILGSE